MHARSPLAFHAALAGLALCLSAVPAAAQQSLAPHTPSADVSAFTSAPVAGPTVDTARVAGPTVDAARVAASEPTSHELKVTTAAPRRAGYGQPVALMVVGGAALLTGLIISGDAGTVIAVGGALVGLYGLYEFLQ